MSPTPKKPKSAKPKAGGKRPAKSKRPERSAASPAAPESTALSEVSVQPVHASYSQMHLFQRCKTSYFWRYGLGLTPVMPKEPLLRGYVLHEAYDKYMFEDRASHSIVHDEIDRMFQEEVDKGDASVEWLNQLADTCHEIMTHYLPWADKHDDWTVVIPDGATKCEVKGEILIEVPRENDVPLQKPFLFKIDALVERNGQLMMLENKFRKNLDSSGLEHDLQILAYQAAWNKLYPEHPIKGVVYNIVGAKPRKDGAIATRELFYRGAHEEATALALIRGIMQEMQMQEQLGVWPMTIKKECSWDCDYVGVCLAVRSGGTIQEFVDTGEYRTRVRELG